MSARALDQIYTTRPVARQCHEYLQGVISPSAEHRYLEPSAGDGAFFELMPSARRLGIDVDPKHPEVLQQNFLEGFQLPEGPNRWITLGNPPFGKNTSLAIQFFNKAAEFSEVIAFILPLSFRKQSVQARLSPDFELVADVSLPERAFLLEGAEYSVSCCFQIWKRALAPRATLALPRVHVDFEFCQATEADFAIRRVGRLAGKVLREFSGYARTSHYFVKSRIGAAALAERFEALDWDDVKWNTAGNPSIGKRELVAKYSVSLSPSSKRARGA